MAGHDMLARYYKPNIIIIVEADATTNLELAVPVATFKTCAQGLVLVGDAASKGTASTSAYQNSAAEPTETTIFKRYVEQSSSIFNLA